MRSVETASVVALADTMRPVLLIGFVVGLFGLAALAVVVGRWQVMAKQASRLSKDTGSDKGAIRGGDGTFSTDWLEQARTAEHDDTAPRQTWADVIGLQTGDVDALATDESSPFYPQTSTYETPVEPVYEAPAPPAYQQAPIHEAPVHEVPAATSYETPAPAYAQDLAVEPSYPAPDYQPVPAPVGDDSPFGATHADPVPPVAGEYANEYASFFTTPTPASPQPSAPAPSAEPTNIWALDPND